MCCSTHSFAHLEICDHILIAGCVATEFAVSDDVVAVGAHAMSLGPDPDSCCDTGHGTRSLDVVSKIKRDRLPDPQPWK